MRGWLSKGLLIGSVFALVWLAVIYSWTASNRIPNASDIAFYFVAAPIAVLISVWMISKAWGMATSKPGPDAKAADSGKAQIANADSPDDRTAEQERSLSLGLLATAIRLPHGDSAESLTSKFVANEVSLNLDPELTDANGFPVLTGRIAELDEAAQLEALSEFSGAQNKSDLDWSREQLRAISLSSAVLIELAQQAVSHPQLEAYVAAQTHLREAMPLPNLQLVALLPESWVLEKRGRVLDWFCHVIQQQGWPAEKITIRLERQSAKSRAVLALDRLMLDAFRLSQSCFGIVIACESHVSEHSIERWEEAGVLFKAQNMSGSIPGEGAAGVLVADDAQTLLMASDNSVRLHRALLSQRDKSADASGQISHQLLLTMAQDALKLGKIGAADIKLICSDADHRVSRATELLGMGYELFPELDSTLHYFKLTHACGEIGAVASLAALVLAHQHVLSEASSSLCVSNIDNHERSVVLLSPWVMATTVTA
ncbi:hypothetical protein [Undibacterium sp. Ren11W]|uniref:hypothetical protein n=1 Tax=Undibacterium sp. Ren11W TaxID=3413045 RepID=UPI003BF42AFE